MCIYPCCVKFLVGIGLYCRPHHFDPYLKTLDRRCTDQARAWNFKLASANTDRLNSKPHTHQPSAKIDSSCTSKTSMLETYYSNFIARQYMRKNARSTGRFNIGQPSRGYDNGNWNTAGVLHVTKLSTLRHTYLIPGLLNPIKFPILSISLRTKSGLLQWHRPEI